jgi:Porin subfamily
MRSITRALLGSAAGVFAVAGAQAADLPVKAVPVEYVKVCGLYGAGFWYVPGTDTCIKIGAYVKLQTEYNATNGPFMLGVANNGTGDTGGRNTRTDTSPFTWNQRGVISFDMRTQTEYGTLRSYIDIGEQTTGNDNAVAGNNAQLNVATLFTSRAFIQFAGFTVGRIRSFFDMYFQGTYTFSAQRFGNDTSPNGIVGAAYTYQFAGGLSASLSLEDNSQGAGGRGRSTVNASAPAFGIGTVTFDNKGVEFFDPVFNLRLDQAWGFVGVSAALHDASGGYFATDGAPLLEGNGHPGDKFGWAVSPAFLINSPFGLQGDTVAAQGVWSKGAAGYATSLFGPTAVFGSGLNVGLGWLQEGVFTTGSNVELTTVWSFNAAYEHRWNPQWRTSVYGGMVGVQYDGAAKAMICPGGVINGVAFGTSFRNVTNCDPNFSISEVGTRTLWNPVPDLDVGVDFVWWHLNTAFAGFANLNNAAQLGAKPTGTYTISNQDALSAIFRIQRNFLY